MKNRVKYISFILFSVLFFGMFLGGARALTSVAPVSETVNIGGMVILYQTGSYKSSSWDGIDGNNTCSNVGHISGGVFYAEKAGNCGVGSRFKTGFLGLGEKVEVTFFITVVDPNSSSSSNESSDSSKKAVDGIEGGACYACGNSQNQGISISKGLISKSRVVIELANKSYEVIATDAYFSEGCSGGALINKKSELIGITTFRLKDSIGNIIYGMGYAIPIDIVKDYIKLRMN